MDDITICESCRKEYSPVEVNGVWKLKTIDGYTIDLKLQQFRKVIPGVSMEFVEFDSKQGAELLEQMHKSVIN